MRALHGGVVADQALDVGVPTRIAEKFADAALGDFGEIEGQLYGAGAGGH